MRPPYLERKALRFCKSAGRAAVQSRPVFRYVFQYHLVTVPFAMSTMVFMLRCPILLCQSYAPIASYLSPMLKTVSSSPFSKHSCGSSSETPASASPATRSKSGWIICGASGYPPFFNVVRFLGIVGHESIAAESGFPTQMSRWRISGHHGVFILSPYHLGYVAL